MSPVTFTPTDGWGSPGSAPDRCRIEFVPRDAPWATSAGAIVVPRSRGPQEFTIGVATSVDLEAGPWTLRLGGGRRVRVDVPPGGGALGSMISDL